MSAALVLALLGGGEAPPPSFTERAAEIAAHVRGARWNEGLAAADAALSAAGLSERQQAELQHARGVILLSRALEAPAHGRAGVTPAAPSTAAPGAPAAPAEPGLPAARDAFSSARALAGPSALRLDATYDMGLVSFHEGERARALLPEIAGAPPTGPTTAAIPGGPGAALPALAPGAQGHDLLPVAREAYGRAKAVFVERLRVDWHDEDTRANLELLQKRLAELDALEKQREQQKQQQDRQPGEQPQDKQDQDGGDSQEPQPSDAQKGDQGQEQENGQGQPDSEQEPSQDAQQQSPQPEHREPAELPKDASGGDPRDAQATPPENGPPDEEAHLTREEVQQLLDKLADLEKQAGALEAALRAARKKPVARDW